MKQKKTIVKPTSKNDDTEARAVNTESSSNGKILER